MGLFLPYGRCGWCDGAAPPVNGGVVTDRIALALALVIFGAIGADIAFNDGIATMFLLRKMEDLIIYVSFWR
jgi:hypothetical protein